ncbi:MAG: HEAT repeat domain-containing protein [Planctomycetes bacterium]|nr:HEAT repeat domain-containing protein [Planctomycetota bacterium]
MRSVAFTTLLALAACGTTSQHQSEFVQPNQLMGQEISRRIEEIRYQHRDVLVNNLLWLSQAGEQAIPALIEGLRHEDPKVRANCSWVLAEIGDRRVIPHLQPMVRDSVESVRLESARTLTVLGDLKHVPVLIEGLDSERVQVRYLCHEALKRSTARDFDYDHLTDDKLARSHAVYRWRRWWSEQSNDPFFASSYAQAHGLRSEDATGTDGGQPAVPSGETQPTPQPVPPAPQGQPQRDGD